MWNCELCDLIKLVLSNIFTVFKCSISNIFTNRLAILGNNDNNKERKKIREGQKNRQTRQQTSK